MPLVGHIDVCSRSGVRGWAWDAGQPDIPVGVVVSVGGRILGRCLADRDRPDLAASGTAGGHCGFELLFPDPLSPLQAHEIAVRGEGSGVHLHASPYRIAAPTALDDALRGDIERLLGALAAADVPDAIAFLAAQLDGLRNALARQHSGRGEVEHRRALSWQQLGLAAPARPDTAPRPRALVVDDRMPLAAHDAGSNAILSHMRSLQRLGYDVTFAPANLYGDDAALAAAGIGCCLQPWYGSIEEVLRRQRGGFDLVYLHRVSTAARYVALARDHQPGARIVYSVADLHHLRLARHAEVEGRPELAAYGEHVRLSELTAAWHADAVITHSTAEAAVLRRHMRPEKVHVVPWSLTPAPTAVPFAARRGVAFVGGYGHQPNVDAALRLVDEVVPALAARGGAIPCLLVGSDMPESLRGLQRQGVEPVGFVPALSTLFDRVRLTVAPLAYGAGIKGKVLDSLAAGVPCVCSPAAAEGLDLPEVLLAHGGETAAELAAAIERLHEDEALHQACRDAGLDYIRDKMSEARIDEGMRRAVQ